MPLDRIHRPLILSLISVIATGYHENFTQVSSHTHNSLKHFPHFSSPSRGTSSTRRRQAELYKVMVLYSIETSRLHRTLLKQPMAGPRGKASNKEGLSTTEGSRREQSIASGATKGLSPPSVRKVLVFFGVMSGNPKGIQRFRSIREALSAGWSFSGESVAANRAALGVGALRSSAVPGKRQRKRGSPVLTSGLGQIKQD